MSGNYTSMGVVVLGVFAIALAMVEAGVLRAKPQIARIFALHVWPGLASGTIAGREGTIMAAVAIQP